MKDGAELSVELDGPRVSVSFSLNVDLFVPTTRARARDNVELALVNGPRLDAFLRRLRDAVGGHLRSLDAGDYGEQLTPSGVA